MAAMLAACTGSGGQQHADDEPAVDARHSVDARPSTVTDLECVEHLRVQGTPGAARTETRTYFALVDGVDPQDGYMVERCYADSSALYVCGVGEANCVDSGAPNPAGDVCSWTNEYTFVGSKMIIICGHVSSVFDSSNVETYHSDSRPAALRLHRF